MAPSDGRGADAPQQSGADAPQQIRIELLTSPGCHLCEVARGDLDDVAGPLGLTWTEVDASQDLELLKRHAEDLPVVRVNGVPRDFWRVDKARLTRILTGLQAGRDPEAI